MEDDALQNVYGALRAAVKGDMAGGIYGCVYIPVSGGRADCLTLTVGCGMINIIFQRAGKILAQGASHKNCRV